MLGRMDYGGASHIGLVRQTNEDSYLIADMCKSVRVLNSSLDVDPESRLYGDSKGVLLAVADGMGGHEAGERASQLAVDSVIHYVLNELHWSVFDETSEPHVEKVLKQSVIAARDALVVDAHAMPHRKGMGTTLTMLLVHWPIAYLIHIGDSRCYLLRDGRMRRLTRDHTVEQLRKDLENNTATAEQQRLFGEYNWSAIKAGEALWNVIATNADQVHPEITKLRLELGDALLLCTDGLSRHVNDEAIAAELNSTRVASAICDRLLIAANENGGSDNSTIVVAKFLPNQELAAESEKTHAMDTSDTDTGEYPAASLSATLDFSEGLELQHE